MVYQTESQSFSASSLRRCDSQLFRELVHGKLASRSWSHIGLSFLALKNLVVTEKIIKNKIFWGEPFQNTYIRFINEE